MKTNIRKKHSIKQTTLKSCLFMSSLIFSACAFAIEPSLTSSSDMGAIVTKWQGIASMFKTFMWTAAQAAGIFFALNAVSLWKKIANNKSDKSYAQAALIFGIGCLGYFLPYAMGTTGSALLSV